MNMQTAPISRPTNPSANPRHVNFDIFTAHPIIFVLVPSMSLESGDIHALAQALQALHSAAPVVVPSISSVFIKLQPFWVTRPEVWFCSVAAQFVTRNPPITADLTKFNHVVAALDNVTAGKVEAIILSPKPTTDMKN